MSEAPRFRAFISYSHADEAWGKWLHQKLERYRVPSRLVGRTTPRGVVPRRIGRCFRDQAELSAATHLGETLQAALRDSYALIVVCSPRSAGSHWVNEEIKYFRSLGRTDAIFALIVDGDPHAKEPSQECFPLALRDEHPLAADARESGDGKTDGFLKLVAGILGLGFDELRQRERRRRARLTIAAISASLAIAATTTVLAISAQRARNEATSRREAADGLIAFMLGDLKERLDKVGRLDVLDVTVAKALDYMGRAELATADAATLAQRSRAFANLSEIYYARGQLAEAVSAGREAIAAATALQSLQPGEEADELLAHALLARGEPSLEAGVDEENTRGARTALEISRRLHGATPGPARAYLFAKANDQVGYVESNMAAADIDQAALRWQECSKLMRPLAQAQAADSKFLVMQLRCELQSAIILYNNRRLIEGLPPFVKEATAAAQRYPRDLAVAYILQAGLGTAAFALSHGGRLPEAKQASDAAIALGERMTAFDPDNAEWLRWHANAVRAAVSIDLKMGDLAAAQRHADASLALFEVARSRDPGSINLRWELANLRAVRGELAHRRADGATARAELAAGLAVSPTAGEKPAILATTMDLHLLRWLWSTRPPGQADEDLVATRDILSTIEESESSLAVSEQRAALAYALGDVALGDSLAARSADDPATSAKLKEFRVRATAQPKKH